MKARYEYSNNSTKHWFEVYIEGDKAPIVQFDLYAHQEKHQNDKETIVKWENMEAKAKHIANAINNYKHFKPIH